MKKINVKISGTSPVLMHRFQMEKDEKNSKKDKQYDAKEDALKALYKDEKGCYIPSTWIEATMREAGKSFKNKKSTYKSTIVSSVFVEQDKIYLNKETYDEIDMRPVVVQRNRIVRSRPKFNNWKLDFTISFDEDKIHQDTLKAILEEAGKCKGIGDYRPEKGGKYGRFKVDEFKVSK